MFSNASDPSLTSLNAFFSFYFAQFFVVVACAPFNFSEQITIEIADWMHLANGYGHDVKL